MYTKPYKTLPLNQKERKKLRFGLIASIIFIVIAVIFFSVILTSTEVNFGFFHVVFIVLAILFIGWLIYIKYGIVTDLIKNEKQIISGTITNKTYDSGTRKNIKIKQPYYLITLNNKTYAIQPKSYSLVNVGDFVNLHWAPNAKYDLGIEVIKKAAEKVEKTISKNFKTVSLSKKDIAKIKRKSLFTILFFVAFGVIPLFVFLSALITGLSIGFWWIGLAFSPALLFTIHAFKKIKNQKNNTAENLQIGKKYVQDYLITDKQTEFRFGRREYILYSNNYKFPASKKVFKSKNINETITVSTTPIANWILTVN